MSTCNRLNLQTLGSQPIMLKNLPDHNCKPKELGIPGGHTLIAMASSLMECESGAC